MQTEWWLLLNGNKTVQIIKTETVDFSHKFYNSNNFIVNLECIIWDAFIKKLSSIFYKYVMILSVSVKKKKVIAAAFWFVIANY